MLAHEACLDQPDQAVGVLPWDQSLTHRVAEDPEQHHADDIRMFVQVTGVLGGNLVAQMDAARQMIAAGHFEVGAHIEAELLNGVKFIARRKSPQSSCLG